MDPKMYMRICRDYRVIKYGGPHSGLRLRTWPLVFRDGDDVGLNFRVLALARRGPISSEGFTYPAVVPSFSGMGSGFRISGFGVSRTPQRSPWKNTTCLLQPLRTL